MTGVQTCALPILGFRIFERSGKGAALTPAGVQFVSFLSGMREDLKRAVEQGQNFSSKFSDSVSISLMVRQAVYFLPEAIRLFADEMPDVQIVPIFRYENGMDSFLKGDGSPLVGGDADEEEGVVVEQEQIVRQKKA